MPDTAIIWAVHDPGVTLYAFNAGTGAKIDSWPAGSWERPGLGIYNIVPVVANGRVYVASDRQLQIFGLGFSPIILSQFPPVRVVGEVKMLDGSWITLETP